MKKNIKIWCMLVVFILNIILAVIPSNNAWAMKKNQYSIIRVDEGIKYLSVYNDNILLINNEGQAILRKDEIDIKIQGNNFRMLAKNLIINDENKIYDVFNEEFLDEEVAEKYLSEVNYLEKEYNLEDIYFFDDKVAVKVKNKEVNVIIYLQKVNDVYVEVDRFEDDEANDIYIDNNEKLYVKKENKLLQYENDEYIELCDFSSDYDYSIYDNNIVAYNNDQYIKLESNNLSSEENKSTIDDTQYDNSTSSVNTDIKSNELSCNIEPQSNEESIVYQSHVQNIGWQGWKSDGELSGSEGKSYRLEAIRIKINNLPEGIRVAYRTHIQDIGWQGWKYDGELAGTEGQGKRLEAIEVKLLNAPSEYHVEYRVHVQDIG